MKENIRVSEDKPTSGFELTKGQLEDFNANGKLTIFKKTYLPGTMLVGNVVCLNQMGTVGKYTTAKIISVEGGKPQGAGYSEATITLERNK